MTWFKSLVMRQNSPLLLIDDNPATTTTSREAKMNDEEGKRQAASELNSCYRSKLASSVKQHHFHNNHHFGRRLRQRIWRHNDDKDNDDATDENSDCSTKSASVARQTRVRRFEEQQQQQAKVRAHEHNNNIDHDHNLQHQHQHPTHRLPNLVPLVEENHSQQAQDKREDDEETKSARSKSQTQTQTTQTSSSSMKSPNFTLLTSQHQASTTTTTTPTPTIMRRTQRASLCFTFASGAACCHTALLLFMLVASLALAAPPSGSQQQQQQQQYFEVQPESMYLVQNAQDVRLRCLIRNRQGECLWLKNGRAVGVIAKKYIFSRQPEDGDCSLMIRNVSVQQDDAIWQCQVTASDVEQDTLQSREVSLVVLMAPEKPQIKNTSQNTQRLILEENKNRMVTCEIRGGNPAPQIEWILEGKNISKEAQTSSFLAAPGSSSQAAAAQSSSSSSSSSQRITQSKLKLSDIKRTMNGKNLTCVGVHQTLNQSTSVELDVQYVPTVSVVQREYSIVEGSPLSISCQVDSNPPPNIVNWRLVSDVASSRQQQQQQQAANGALSLPTRPGPVLEFERISRDHNQNIFECLAQNSYGISLPADVKLNVLYAPFLLNTSHSESVMLGSEAQLACVFDGNPEPEVKWHYTDPLSRSASAIQLDNSKQQYLNIKNVSYRNEGDYHCEARNQINGVFYGVRSSNIILDVYGEPQFLLKSPVYSKAVQGTKSDLSLTFCSDPPPQKVYWQFGSLRLDVRLNNVNKDAVHVAPPVGGKQHAINQRFHVHSLQSLQKRESSFSKQPTCFEATLTIFDPELTDQRDYTLVVQNERGHQSAVARLKVSSPLSPVLMITSAFVTICGLFLLSLLAMFVLKRRPSALNAIGNNNSGNTPNGTANGGGQNGALANGGIQRSEKSALEHLKNGGGVALPAATQLLQQTRGIVNGSGNGLANGASNPNNPNGNNCALIGLAQQQTNNNNNNSLSSMSDHHHSMVTECPKGGGGGGLMSSMGAHSVSDTSSANDQKQLLSGAQSDRSHLSSSASSTSSGTTNQCMDFISGVVSTASSTTGGNNTNGCHSTASSTPTPLNHVSVEHDLVSESECNTILSPSSRATDNYRATSASMTSAETENDQLNSTNNINNNNHMMTTTSNHSGASSSSSSNGCSQEQSNALIYANLDYNDSRQHSPSESSLQSIQIRQHQHQQQQQVAPSTDLKGNLMRSNVGATIAMMNSLAAAANRQSAACAAAAAAAVAGQQSPNSVGALNGAINQQLAAQTRQIRKPGPPKPPKPSIQQRSRFYQQHAAQANNGSSNGSLVMIGSPTLANAAAFQLQQQQQQQQQQHQQQQHDSEPSANELAVEYSRLAFPARAEI